MTSDMILHISTMMAIVLLTLKYVNEKLRNRKLKEEKEVEKSVNNIILEMLCKDNAKEMRLKTTVLRISNNNYCCWVNEHDGYYAYCFADGRLRTRSGYGKKYTPTRTWSSVEDSIIKDLKRNE